MHGVRIILLSLLLIGCACVQAADAQELELDARLMAVEQVYRKEGAAEALPEFERLLVVFTARNEVRNIAIVQSFIGECHWRMGNLVQSREHLDIALSLKRQLGDRLQEGKTLNVLGLLEWDLGNFNEAIARFGEASIISEEIGDKKLQGATLNNISLVYDELGDYHKSLEQYRQVLTIYTDLDFPRGQGDTLGNIGGVHLLLGHYSKAVNYYRQALAISEQMGSAPALSQDHGNLGLSYSGLGRKELALEHLEKALQLAEQAGMRQEEGFWLRGMGNAQIRAGRYDLGLESHRAALEIYTETGAEALLLEALHDMGELLLQLGDPTSAEQHFQRAIELARSMDMSRGITANQLALGDLQYRHQRLEDAAALYGQALQRARKTGEAAFQAQALLRLAAIHRDRKKHADARLEIEEALRIAREFNARGGESAAIYHLAELDRAQDQHTTALEHYTAAGILASEVGELDLQWRVEYGRALSLSQLGQKQAAVDALLRAVGQIESVRNRLREKRFRAGYLQDKHQVYIELVRLQLELGKASRAFSTAERLRSWSFMDQSDSAETAAWTSEQRRSEIELRERIRQLERVLREENELPAPERRQLAIDTFSQEMMLAEAQYQAFLDDMEGRGAGRLPGRITIDEERTRNQLGPREALIEYIVGEDNVTIFVLTAKKLQAVTTAVSRINLHSRLELLRDLLQQPDNERWTRPAARLSQILLEPVGAEGWLDGIEHLYLVPHGMLNYLPFALLPIEAAGEQNPVISSYTLSYLPSATVLSNGGARLEPSRSVLAVAPGRSRLRHAPEEVASIVKLFQPDARKLTGEQATESRFRDIAGEYRILHLATHGYFNKLNPMLSGLELEPDETNDGLLEVHEILDLDLDSDLVTLSACQTGMSSGYFNEIPAGDDFVGLTRAFLKAGSSSVLATLWEVDDRSTVDLMKSFYTHLEEAGANNDKVVALADAQRTLQSSEKYQHPYYWAPFVLVGAMNQKNHSRG